MAYKKDQGRLTRLAAFWSLAILVFSGCVSLHGELVGRFPALARPLIGGLQKIPLLGWSINAGLLISGVVLIAAWVLLARWQETPKVADLLIETEAELRKVTWPTMPEAVNSSVIVIFCVVFLMAFLAGSDYLLGRITTRILTGGAG